MLMNMVQDVGDVGAQAGRGALAGVIARSLSRSRRRGAYYV
ncbi:MAG: hypothetical protein O7F70_02490 [Gemmatimonadetes bacterium]|nr:hypothetical protein [Gemmatimonadota bacterium]